MAEATGTGALRDLLAGAGERFQTGFAQSPGEAVFVRRDEVALASHVGPIDLDSVFDLRLSTSDAELHWWWDQQECEGRWAILDDEVAADLGARSTIRGRRLLRGTVIERDEPGGWSLIHDGHSRPLWLPIIADKGERVVVGVVEYVSHDRHGNAGVFAERFTTWEVL